MKTHLFTLLILACEEASRIELSDSDQTCSQQQPASITEFKCTLCNETFSRNKQFLEHMSDVHGFAGGGLGGGSSVEETEEESDDDDIGEDEPPSKQV